MTASAIIRQLFLSTVRYLLCLAVFGVVVCVLGPWVAPRSGTSTGPGCWWWVVAGGLDRRLIGVSVVALGVVVAMVRPLDRLLTQLVDRVFVQEGSQYRETLKKASAGMGQVRDLPKLLFLIARVIVTNVRVTHATIFLKDQDRPEFVVAASHGPCKKPVGRLRVAADSPLIAWLARSRAPVMFETLSARLARERAGPAFQPAGVAGSGVAEPLAQVVAELMRLEAAVCVPSMVDGKIKGFLALGAKRSRAIYSQEDLEFFSTAASQAVPAIENAEAYGALRDTRDQLLQSERLATIGRFASNMAHEIKNPLQAIKTFFEYLPVRYQDPEFREGFSRLAKAEADRIDQLVRELVSYATPRPPQWRPIELQPVMDSVLSLLAHDLAKHRIEVRTGYSPNGLRLEADRDQMKQVFLNLCLNAIDAMASPERASNLLEVIAFPIGEVMVAKVRDHGCGIAAAQLPMVGTPFYTTKEQGSGLGLAIVQNIVQAHHATIQVESQVGRGTTVTVTLPRRQPTA